MSQLPIIEYPDPRLHQASEPVETFDEAVAQLVVDLCDTLAATTGLGLCAPQLGVLRQVLIVAPATPGDSPEAFINPEILSRSGFAVCQEACLSLPGVKANVIRSADVHVRAQDRHGCVFERQLDGMQAICLQHEIDHLQGKLFIDRLSSLRRLRFRSTLADLRLADLRRRQSKTQGAVTA